MRKLLKLSIFFVLLCAVAYIGINILIDPISERVIRFAFERMQGSSFSLSKPVFRNARIALFDSIVWDDFSVAATLSSGDASKRALFLRVKIGELRVKMTSLPDGLFVLSMTRLYVAAENSPGYNPDKMQNVLQEGSYSAQFQLSLTHPSVAAAQIRHLAIEMKKLAEEGKTELPVKFAGTETIVIDDNSYSVRIWTEQREKESYLMANRDDLKYISEQIASKSRRSTDADIDIIANNAVRAPRLLKISSTATKTAAKAFEQDSRVPEDAYRHVLWSYLLTREYGADFSKQVTDAHELTQNPGEGNDPSAQANHRQDYVNGGIGRKYATLGYPESDILKHVMTDPEIIR